MKKCNVLKSNNGLKNIKGFTIVELVIVIAVIAILAAVLIPTFSSVVEKSNVVNDKSLVRNINNVLEINSSTDNTINDKTQLRILLNDYGINTTKNKAQNHIIFWSKSENMCFIWGIKEQRIIFPEYIRNKTLDDFPDEINISTNEVTNQVVNAGKYGYGYCVGLVSPGRLATNKKDYETIASDGYVATGAIPIDTTKYDSLNIYIKGGKIDGSSFCAIHIIMDDILYKQFDLNANQDYELKENKQINITTIKLTEEYYRLEITNYDEIIEGINNKTIYFAISLIDEDKDLIITFNEEIMMLN